ncbi:(2Fe-2S)-binding protein [Noviherbaspirillum suwonense]|jgi:aerobic-type carbon monoxide dehydrogenase small subunit (CoxS/CutS family)|uniref:Carbon-monoxide dehydrogenase small subunit n=1 Tax=Noviherbaspirillum suwonense TaxID=1224511 RepID=A0ABY1QC55_9BURK|nr:(2Fe-2S)-binding protein [Noviherbaspirillum suwonense]SMP63361.1 carbon-monoxide dehydrogenase small subunit [Noviherbaspirillum suwonense]
MSDTKTIHLTVNGQYRRHEVRPRQHLVDFLREELDLTGSHLGCEHGVCGACTVKLDGAIVRGCLVLAVQADGKSVQTIEGLSESGAMRDLQQAFLNRNALQCGYCTSGMLMAASELIDTQPDASREQVRQWISGNYCRCTGYQAIVDAICDVLADRRDAGVRDDKGVAA